MREKKFRYHGIGVPFNTAMTTNSGIVPSTDLVATCVSFLSNPVEERILSIQVANNLDLQLDHSLHFKATSDFNADLNTLSSQLDSQCRFLLIKIDDSANAFVSYIPNEAKIRDKMIYASTKNSLINAIGSSTLKVTMQANSAAEVSADGWSAHMEADNSNVLSESEISLLQVKQSELLSKSSKRELVNQSNAKLMLVNLPTELTAKTNLSKGDLLSFTIENDDSLILNSTQHTVSVDGLTNSLTVKDSPAYYVYQSEGDETFFIYSCPSGSKVRQRMIYASNKQPLTNELQGNYNWKFTKVIEIGDADELELSEFKLVETNQSSTPSSTRGFSKPRGPRRR